MLVSMALIIICKLIGSEMIPPLLPLVQEKLLHPKYARYYGAYNHTRLCGCVAPIIIVLDIKVYTVTPGCLVV